jgi:hypothetical protein
MDDQSKYSRWVEPLLRERLLRPYIHILFGARQTGKTFLLNALLPENTLRINLADPQERTRFSADPGEFMRLERHFQKVGRLVSFLWTMPRFFLPFLTLYKFFTTGIKPDGVSFCVEALRASYGYLAPTFCQVGRFSIISFR